MSNRTSSLIATSMAGGGGPLPCDVIKSERRAAGLTVPQMAERLQFVEADYKAIELGFRLPTKRFVRAFSEICALATAAFGQDAEERLEAKPGKAAREAGNAQPEGSTP